MNKENEDSFNLGIHPVGKDPFIDISNNSKSNSSNNQKSLKFSKNLHNITDNNQSSSSFRKYHKRSKKTKNKKEENSSSFYYSINNSNNQLLNESKEKSGENKSLSEKRENIIKLELETPKKKSDKNKMFEENLKNKKKDLLNIDNIHGKNLMQRFEEMSEKIVFEEKNKNRVSSVENEIKSYSKIKNIVVNTNKSWNKKKYGFPLSKNPIKLINKDKINQGINFPIKKKTKIMTRYNTSNIKELQNLLNKNKYNIDLKSLIDKYRPKKINKKEIKNNTFLIDKNNTDNKGRFKKLRKTPNSDSHNRKLSFSLKIRDTLTKNLMQDYYKKNTEMINVNKYINTNERKPKDILYEKNIMIHNPLKNNNFFQLIKNNNLMDTKKKSQNENQNKPKINDFYLKYKEKWGIGKNKKSGI